MTGQRSSPAPAGELALVLHTHMPYVEGYGTWPFGEEWLWEAIATCYVPLVDVLARRFPDGAAPLTVSITPVLADQLEAPGVMSRLRRFLVELRPDTHARDAAALRAQDQPEAARSLERSARDYARAARRLEQLGGDLLGALAPYARWTSAATHALLPLLATDAGVRLQVGTGIASHRRRFGRFDGGFWLPECAHAPWLDPLLRACGVTATCLDLTDFLGRGSGAQLRPLDGGGLTLAPLDRETIELVWSLGGYPSHAAYRDYHALTRFQHRAWANDGRPYDHAAGLAQARGDAADFVARIRTRLERAGGGLLTCAIDTELLGHWWYEGVAWLDAVIGEAERQGLALAALDAALARHEPGPLPPGGLPTTSWGEGRDLRTWAAPAVADLAWQARDAELRVVAAASSGSLASAAARELLALQSSDWAFMATRALAGDYPRERAAGHRRALDGALAALDSGPPGPRHLAPEATPALLRQP